MGFEISGTAKSRYLSSRSSAQGNPELSITNPCRTRGWRIDRPVARAAFSKAPSKDEKTTASSRDCWCRDRGSPARADHGFRHRLAADDDSTQAFRLAAVPPQLTPLDRLHHRTPRRFRRGQLLTVTDQTGRPLHLPAQLALRLFDIKCRHHRLLPLSSEGYLRTLLRRQEGPEMSLFHNERFTERR